MSYMMGLSEEMNNNATSSGATISMDDLYPALFECFAVILCGYIAGRQNLLSQAETKGLDAFVRVFSLPALIFLSLAELDLRTVNWTFLLSILVAKSIVFLLVVIITLLISRPVNPARAGLFAIFCTQSNDFAIGYPIVAALYSNVHPEYASYLYLMAPISLAILNPIGFILMEIGRHNSTTSSELFQQHSKIYLILSVARSIMCNPIVFMTIFGIIGNLIFDHHLPSIISGLLKVLGSAFTAVALFSLGLRMVGKMHTLNGSSLLVPGVLIAVKLLVLPLITREVVSLFHAGENSTDTLDLSTYGFLYGTFPSAPGVFVFATQYSVDIDLIASSMVACTFVSAPLMFVSAKMITVDKMAPSSYLQELDSFAFDISVAGIVACAWLLVIYICNKKYKKILHRVTFCLIISQIIACIGVILWSVLDRSKTWALYLQFAFYTVGVYSSRLWTAFLAITLLFFQCRSLCFALKLQPYFMLTGWGIPLVIVIFLVLFVKQEDMSVEKCNPNFQFGGVQAIITVILLVLCLTVTVGCLILHQRYWRRYARYLSLVQDINTSEPRHSGSMSCSVLPGINNCLKDTTEPEGPCSSSPRATTSSQIMDIENLDENGVRTCPSQFSCPSDTRARCQQRLEDYYLEQDDIEDSDYQVLRHVVLIILLVSSMFTGIALSVWTLIMEAMSGIYVELSFLDASLNFGQSIFVFAIFGLSPKAAILPFIKLWRRVRYGTSTLSLPQWEELNFETRHVCDQFVMHHLEKCRSDISEDRRWHFRTYREVFKGSALVTWLIEAGLARDRQEAVQYATDLLQGRVIRHINDLHHFHDQSLLYTFCVAQR
ncbi:integral membrane protein GPR155 [Schistocerca serialis cubense]|uniref:integral membrane protein GPR155 n=1 Tax=Schistocerca serialis cubense TaxID=2023355 RepID=UPI00214ED580|nr:integral membrane protein GPR155 [Schistocerca serialis cubense]